MIFVTVGTHEQSFNRLIKEIDNLKKNGNIKEKVIVQTGYSTYKPKYCESKSMFSFNEMMNYITKAHIVITHGGPSSFIEVLQTGKIPIVVPRLKKFNEHINDHQLEFVKLIAKTRKNIIPVYDIKNLDNIIKNYDELIRNCRGIESNNQKFNMQFSQMIIRLFH